MEEIICIQQPLNLIADLKEHLEDVKKNKTTTYSNWEYGGYSRGSSVNTTRGWESDYRTIYFYEFSDTNRAPKTFSRVSDFVKWCEEHKIFMSDYTKSELKTNTLNYVTCYVNSATLIIRHTYQELKLVSESQKEYRDYYCGRYPEGRWPDPNYDDYWD